MYVKKRSHKRIIWKHMLKPFMKTPDKFCITVTNVTKNLSREELATIISNKSILHLLRKNTFARNVHTQLIQMLFSKNTWLINISNSSTYMYICVPLILSSRVFPIDSETVWPRRLKLCMWPLLMGAVVLGLASRIASLEYLIYWRYFVEKTSDFQSPFKS